jgi:hypothetical protein
MGSAPRGSCVLPWVHNFILACPANLKCLCMGGPVQPKKNIGEVGGDSNPHAIPQPSQIPCIQVLLIVWIVSLLPLLVALATSKFCVHCCPVSGERSASGLFTICLEA